MVSECGGEGYGGMGVMCVSGICGEDVWVSECVWGEWVRVNVEGGAGACGLAVAGPSWRKRARLRRAVVWRSRSVARALVVAR